MRDVDGFAIWRVRVVKGEVTCQQCGEVYVPSVFRVCPRCNNKLDDDETMATPVVPTVDYLQPGEYEYA